MQSLGTGFKANVEHVTNRQKSHKRTERAGIARLAKQRTRSCNCFVLSPLALSCPILSYLALVASPYLPLPYPTLSYFILSHRLFSYLVFSYRIVSYLILSCLALPCLVLSCLVLSPLILSYRIVRRLMFSCAFLSCLVFVLPCVALPYVVLSCVALPCSKENTSVRTRYRRNELAEIRGAIKLGAANLHSENTFVVHDCGSNFDGVCAALRKRGYVFVLIVP
jgi:hypothetical protein